MKTRIRVMLIVLVVLFGACGVVVWLNPDLGEDPVFIARETDSAVRATANAARVAAANETVQAATATALSWTPTPSPREASGRIQVVCLSVEQIGSQEEETSRFIEDILSRIGVRVEHESSQCDANLSFSIEYSAVAGIYSQYGGRPDTTCYTGARVANTAILTVEGYAPWKMSTYGVLRAPGGTIYSCPDEEHAPYTRPWAEAILRVVSEIWGPRSIIPAFEIIEKAFRIKMPHMMLLLQS